MKKLIFLVLIAAIGFYVAWPAFTGYRIYSNLEGKDPQSLAQRIDFPSVRQSMREPVLRQVKERLGGVMKSLGPIAGLGNQAQLPDAKIEQIVDGTLESVVTPEKVVEIYGRGGDYSGAVQEAVLEQIDKMGGLAAIFGISGEEKPDQTGNDRGNGGGFSVGGFKVPGGLGGLVQNKQVGGIVKDVIGQSGLDPAKLAGKLFPKLGGGGGSSGKTDGGSQSFGLSNVKDFGFAGPLGLKLGVARQQEASKPDVTAYMEFKNYDWRITKLVPNLIE